MPDPSVGSSSNIPIQIKEGLLVDLEDALKKA